MSDLRKSDNRLLRSPPSRLRILIAEDLDEKARALRPDLLILNVTMPGHGGRKLKLRSYSDLIRFAIRLRGKYQFD